MTKKAFGTFAKTGKDGLSIVVNEDDFYADDHPYVKAWPDMFGDLDDVLHILKAPARAPKPVPVVEQATAAPGEVRETARPPVAAPARRKPGRPRKTS